MPGINTLGTPLTTDYVVGKGIVYFAAVDANGFPKDFVDLGNAPAFSLSMASEQIEHQSSRAGLRVIDKKVNVSLTVSASFTLDEINFDNLAKWLSGSTTTLTQNSGTITPNGTTQGNLRVSGKGKWYDIYDNAPATTGFAYPPANTANRVVDISTVLVKTLAGVAFTIGTDYLLDLRWGRIFIPSTSTITASQEIAITFTRSAKTIDQVSGLTQSQIAGALKFIQKNAANNSVESEWQIHAATLTAEGDLALLGEEFVQMQFTASIEAREAVDPVAPTVRVRYFT